MHIWLHFYIYGSNIYWLHMFSESLREGEIIAHLYSTSTGRPPMATGQYYSCCSYYPSWVGVLQLGGVLQLQLVLGCCSAAQRPTSPVWADLVLSRSRVSHNTVLCRWPALWCSGGSGQHRVTAHDHHDVSQSHGRPAPQQPLGTVQAHACSMAHGPGPSI